MPSGDHFRWIRHVTDFVKSKFGLESSIEQSKHIVVTFWSEQGRWPWRLATTPSDVRSRRNALSQLRKGLEQTFGIEGIRSLSEFPMQDFESTVASDRQLKKEWDEFFETLLHI